MNMKEIQFIKNTIFNLVSFHYDGEITVNEGTELSVCGDARNVKITYTDKAELARGFFLLAKEISGGKNNIDIHQKRHFATLGVMPDLRANLLTVESLKKYIDHMAAVGMNSLLFYIEDCFELDGYPYFGHMSGRYSCEEMKEIDEYANRLGVEIVPSIQTLAHLATYMRWQESGPVKETSSSLMVGAEATYQFIEAMIKTMKKCFSTKKIHLGMDEARELGLGKHLNEHGYTPKSTLFAKHLNRVKEICFKYELEPEIWSDMVFRACGGHDAEYSARAQITDDVKEAVSGVELMYWDYYEDSKDIYCEIIDRHRKVSDNISFAGGIWNWDGYIPNFAYTMKTMKPAMEACLDKGIDIVYATVWDNPRDTFLAHSIYDFAIFSEYCYLGYDCAEEDIHNVGQFLTGHDKEVLALASELFQGYNGAVSMGPRFIHCDVFYEIMRYPVDYDNAAKQFFAAAKELEKFEGDELAEHARRALLAAGTKAELLSLLRPAYQKRDMAAIQDICDNKLPSCIEAVSTLGEWVEKLWLKYQKPFCIEEVQMRFAGLVKRLYYQQEKLNEFLNNPDIQIPELEEKALNSERATWIRWQQNAYARI